MKAKSVLSILIAGFLAISACTNPILAELYNTNEETHSPETPTLGNPHIEDTPTVTYTVDFDTNGGSPVDCQPVAEGDTATRPENPAKSGFGFVNWYDCEALTKPHYDFDTPVTDDITLFAEWSQIFHTVIFDSCGGSDVADQVVGENGTASRSVPTKDGYTFDGWYTDSELTDAYDFDTPVIIGIILYAKWTLKTYTVTFMDGDTVLAEFTRNIVPHGSTASRPATDPTKDGHTFVDWYRDPGLTVLYNFDTLVIGDITLYAKWIRIITDVADIVACLAEQPEGSFSDNPVYLRLALDLGIMTESTSNWRKILNALSMADKYVDLDLSACTIGGSAGIPGTETVFNPNSSVSTGKNRIVFIALPDVATSIDGAVAFRNFSVLKSFSGTMLTYIGSNAFNGCTNLVMTTLPGGITFIGDFAFQSCAKLALTSLPEGITSIGSDVFLNCAKLALASLPEGITSIGNRSFKGCTNLALASLPAEIISIGDYAFDGCKSLALTSLPAGLTSIGSWAFRECESLALISLPSGITSISEGIFGFCISLARISLPASLTTIGSWAFRDCTNLATVTCLKTTPPTLGPNVFDSTHDSLRIEVPAESVAAYKVAWSAYADRIFAIGDITIPENMLPIKNTEHIVPYLETHSGGSSADNPVPLYLQLDLGNMTNANSNWQKTLIALNTAGKFVDLDLSACTMNGTAFNPDSTVETGKDKIVSIALPDTATSIQNGTSENTSAFRYFTALESFSGIRLTTIGNFSFDNRTSLAQTSLPSEITSIGNNAFRNCKNLALTSLPTGITSIGSYAFQNCAKLALTSLPDGLTSIGSYAFQNCAKLALTELPTGITSIRAQVFRECTNLALTSLPAGLTSIGSYAFENCAKLTLTSLPDGLTFIDAYAFHSCTKLALTELPTKITSIGMQAFRECTNLALTSLPSGLTSIDSYTFYGCTKLAVISLPAGLTSIGNYAFNGCTNLALVTCLAETPPTLGTSALQNTNASLRIEVPVESIAAYKAATNWSSYANKIFAIE